MSHPPLPEADYQTSEYLDINLGRMFHEARPMPSVVSVGAIWECIDSNANNRRGTQWVIHDIGSFEDGAAWVGLYHFADDQQAPMQSFSMHEDNLHRDFRFVGFVTQSDEEPIELEAALRLGEEAFG